MLSFFRSCFRINSENRLFEAVSRGEIERVRILLENEDYSFHCKNTNLVTAIRAKNAPMVQVLCAGGANPNHKMSELGTTKPVLGFAIEMRSPELVNVLLEQGADLILDIPVRVGTPIDTALSEKVYIVNHFTPLEAALYLNFQTGADLILTRLQELIEEGTLSSEQAFKSICEKGNALTLAIEGNHDSIAQKLISTPGYPIEKEVTIETDFSSETLWIQAITSHTVTPRELAQKMDNKLLVSMIDEAMAGLNPLNEHSSLRP